MSPRLGRREFIALSAAAGATAKSDWLWGRDLGKPLREYGERSPFEVTKRFLRSSPIPATGVSRTPLEECFGIITPSALHFESHHSGVPQINPSTHQVLVEGEVETPLLFNMAELRRLPSISRVHFIECSGNTGAELLGRNGPTPGRSHGMASCSEWTGVRLGTLLNEAGVKPSAKWLVAQGADASRMARSIPLEKAMDDVIVAYGQNGEALRPEQGYPVRLVVPGWEGNVNVKWLQRVLVTEGPYMTYEECVAYTDLMPNGKARVFSFVMEAKSVITRPGGGQVLGAPGAYEITGLAWSGRGRITRVEVSTDGGKQWQDAELDALQLPRAFTSFHLPWTWEGTAAILQSRCTDETGYVQPTREELFAVRGAHATDHYNGVKSWKVQPDGKVEHV